MNPSTGYPGRASQLSKNWGANLWTKGAIVVDTILVTKTRWWFQVSNIFYFHPYLGRWSNLTSIFFKWVETTNYKNWFFILRRRGVFFQCGWLGGCHRSNRNLDCWRPGVVRCGLQYTNLSPSCKGSSGCNKNTKTHGFFNAHKVLALTHDTGFPWNPGMITWIFSG